MKAVRPSRDDQILFVGDIQGSHQALTNLLRLSHFQPDRHRLIPLGDTINRGPKNLATLQTLYTLGATPIVGNHELGILETFKRDPTNQWLSTQTVSRDLLKHKEAEAWLDWIGSWPKFIIDKGFIAVHAGLHPRLSLLETPDYFLTRVRLCNADGQFPLHWDGLNHTFPKGYHPWYRWYRGTKHVFYGHWARLGLNRQSKTTGLDSGCVYGNRLSAMWFPSMRLVQATS
jgi:bis(5'-nucleosyl)-tetraphosphatase (symmetrical)